ncbi:hypothetical protein ABOM_005774 [Aspergillus bombycis]|uniref:Tat pathway signal sequence n=1 Tax=Aspergillus bombycis TaxID=109264 RepID=A0A1F8A106_9EURO|nr:hypothetical protein ABOM_005774 [Aspergillus bombycis]OGM45015.1 hypothetical protein ABOM_005774 [Aspergillus bombycis]
MFKHCLSPRYRYLPPEDAPAQGNTQFRRYVSQIVGLWREILITGLCILSGTLLLERAQDPLNWRGLVKSQEYRLTSDDTRWVQFQWHSEVYSSGDFEGEEIANAAWDKIVPAHGIVAVPHEWATQHNLPASMSLFSDHSKGVYIIDAYHQVHCLTVIRRTFTQLAKGETPKIPIGHSRHCFDSLLQYIVCGNSGDTLLYTWGRNVTGDRQLRKCIDWNSRKKWAKENTACYADSDHPVRLVDHFDHCENDDDGIQLIGW